MRKENIMPETRMNYECFFTNYESYQKIRTHLDDVVQIGVFVIAQMFVAFEKVYYIIIEVCSYFLI